MVHVMHATARLLGMKWWAAAARSEGGKNEEQSDNELTFPSIFVDIGRFKVGRGSLFSLLQEIDLNIAAVGVATCWKLAETFTSRYEVTYEDEVSLVSGQIVNCICLINSLPVSSKCD